MTLWYVALGLGAVVIVVVAVLLVAILGEARKIRAGASAIWDAGQIVAGQTVHIAGLAYANHRLAAIAAAVPPLRRVLGSIANHAARCPSCPRCIAAAATGDER